MRPVTVIQNEYMRRMKEMAALQPGMSFYGELPDSYSLVINVAHPLVSKKVRSEAMGALTPVCRADVQCHERLSGSGPQDPFGS